MEELATCPLCGKGIYSVDESTCYHVVDETGRYTSNPTTILQLGEDLDGKHVHITCLPDARLCVDNE